MKKVLIVDDHFVVRKGLAQILMEGLELIAVEEAGSGEEALEMVGARGDYDLILLDITMPGSNGMAVLKELKSRHPQLPVLMLSMHPEEQYAVQCMRAGASGYLMKGCVADELVSAIEKVLAGGKFISSHLAEKLAYELIGNEVKPPHEALSPRENEVMLMIASGKSIQEIAEAMTLSERTINTFKYRFMQKLGLKNNVELTHYVLKHRLSAPTLD